MAVSLVQLTGIDNDLNDVAPLFLNRRLTKNFKDGKPWDIRRVERYLSYFEHEDFLETKLVDFKIILTDNLVPNDIENDNQAYVTIGILTFNSDVYLAGNEYLGKPFIDMMIDPSYQHKGYEHAAILEGIRQYQQWFNYSYDFYSFVLISNSDLYQMYIDFGFSQIKHVKSQRSFLLGFTTSEKSIRSLIRTDGETEPRIDDKIKNFGPVIDILKNLILSGNLPFPYVRTFLPHPKEMMDRYLNSEVNISYENYYNLSGYTSKDNLFLPPTINLNGRDIYIQIISDHFPDYERINALTDIFSEDQRIRAKKVYSKMSTAQCWGLVDNPGNEECVQQIVTKLVNTYVSYENYNLRESIYMVSKDPGLFKLMWVRGILLTLIKDKIQTGTCRFLDISAGWGDRLIGAIAHNCDYLGFDPNVNLKKGHDQIIEMFGDKNRHQVVYQPFEEADLSQVGDFDICLTSPPFFDIEEFVVGGSDVSSGGAAGNESDNDASNDAGDGDKSGTQSIQKFPKFTDWIVGFLFSSLKKAWSKLKVSGFLAIHMGDTKYHEITEPMLLFIEQYLTNSSYVGVIGLAGDGRIAPVWVWKKVSSPLQINRWQPDGIKNRLLIDRYPDIASTYLSATGLGHIQRTNPDSLFKTLDDIEDLFEEVLDQLSEPQKDLAEKIFSSRLLLIPVYVMTDRESTKQWIKSSVEQLSSTLQISNLVVKYPVVAPPRSQPKRGERTNRPSTITSRDTTESSLIDISRDTEESTVTDVSRDVVKSSRVNVSRDTVGSSIANVLNLSKTSNMLKPSKTRGEPEIRTRAPRVRRTYPQPINPGLYTRGDRPDEGSDGDDSGDGDDQQTTNISGRGNLRGRSQRGRSQRGRGQRGRDERGRGQGGGIPKDES